MVLIVMVNIHRCLKALEKIHDNYKISFQFQT